VYIIYIFAQHNSGMLGGPLFSFSSRIHFLFINIRCFPVFLFVFVLCVFLNRNMAPHVTIDFNELPITIVVKHGKLMTKKSAQMVFTIGPRSILAEFPLSNSMEHYEASKG